MVRLLAFVVVGVCFAVFVRTCWIWRINQARRRGVLPKPGQATLFDVRRLLIAERKELAIQVYREIYGVSEKEAARAVEEIEKSVHRSP